MQSEPGEKATNWLTRDALFLSLSAFFADMGYQAVTAVFPLIIIIELKQPAYVYGLLLALSYGVGSIFSLAGGKLGDRFGKKKVALVGNLLIPLMSISVLFSSIYLLSLFFILGWWARYFRSPARRAWLVDVSDPVHRSRIFGFMHALDVGGGLVAVGYAIVFIFVGIPFKSIILFTILPLLVSSFFLFAASTRLREGNHKTGHAQKASAEPENAVESNSINRFIFRALLLSATFFGFSYYALGFPIITVAISQGSALYGILTFGIYLGVSAVSGYLLGTLRGKKPLRTLWSLGYLVAAIASLSIGLSYALHTGLWLYYLGAAGLGFATGSVETFEPVMTSVLVKSGNLSRGMGWLSSSRALGLFVSNVVMGVLFVFGEFDSYLYATITAGVAAAILIAVEIRLGSRLQATGLKTP